MTDAYQEAAEHSSLVLWAAEAEAAAGIAKALATTAFIPDSLRVRDERGVVNLDATVAQVAAALLTGQELGLSPMASLRSIDVIPPGSGSPALRAAALRGLLQYRGHDIEVLESTQTRAVVRGRRAGSPDWYPTHSVWTEDRAKVLGPRGFNDPKGSWVKQRGTMLVARATAEMARWIASDVLLGLPYIVEEIGDGASDGTADGGPGPQAAPGPARHRRARSKPGTPRAGTPLALAPPAPTGDAEVSADGRPAESAGEQPAAAEPPAPRLTHSQRARLWAGLKRLGLVEREPALAAVSGWVGRPITSSNHLTEDEASTVIKAIEDEQLRREAKAAAEQAQAAAEASQDDDPGPDPPPDPDPDGGEH